MTKSVVVTARIPMELKTKIESLDINVTEVIRASLVRAVSYREKTDAPEMESLWDVFDFFILNPIPEELKNLTTDKVKEYYQSNKLSTESRTYLHNLVYALKKMAWQKK